MTKSHPAPCMYVTTVNKDKMAKLFHQKHRNKAFVMLQQPDLSLTSKLTGFPAFLPFYFAFSSMVCMFLKRYVTIGSVVLEA